MSGKRFGGIRGASEAPAENFKVRAKLMRAIVDHIEKTKLTQTEAAKLLGVTQPRISRLVRGKIDLFSIDSLINMASAAGLRVDLRIGRAGQARTQSK